MKIFVAYFLIVILEIVLGCYVLLKNYKLALNRIFFLLCTAFGIWTLCIGTFISPIVLSAQFMRFLADVMFIFGLIVVTSFLLFVWHFPEKTQQLNIFKVTWLILPTFIIAIILLFSDYFVKSINPGAEFKNKIIFSSSGIGFGIFSFFVTTNIIWSIIALVRKYYVFTGINRRRIINLFLGLSIVFILGAFGNAILPALGNVQFVWLSPIYPLAFMFIVSYSILRYRFLEIEIVIKRTTLYFILIAVITGVYTFAIILPYSLLGITGRWETIFFLLLASTIVALTIGPLQRRIDQWTDRVFFQKQYNYYQLLETISKNLSKATQEEDVWKAIINPLVTDVHFSRFIVYLREKSTGPFLAKKKAGQLVDDIPNIAPEDNAMIAYMLKTKSRIETGEFRYQYGHLYSGDEILDPVKAQIQYELDNTFKAALILPLILKDDVIGFIILGEKLSQDQFTTRDLTFLETLANQIVTILENISLYEKMMHQERLVIIGTMSSSIAHEIRNPLSSIKTFIQMLPEKFDKPEFRKSFQDIVPTEIERISGITAELLTLAKPSLPNLENVEIQNIINRILTLINNRLRKAQINVKLNISKEVSLLQGDNQQLSQLFLNILLNAIQASPLGSEITVTSAPKEIKWPGNTTKKFMEVAIADQGVGIKKEDFNNIFKPFFTTKSEGTGLGLAICKRIVESHRGEIFIESEVGKGTTVTVRLPMDLTNETLGSQ